jgi:hypothetical protein
VCCDGVHVSLLVIMVSLARLKRLVQGLTLVAVAAYSTLVLYQIVSAVPSTSRLPPRQQVTVVLLYVLSSFRRDFDALKVEATRSIKTLVTACKTARPQSMYTCHSQVSLPSSKVMQCLSRVTGCKEGLLVTRGCWVTSS